MQRKVRVEPLGREFVLPINIKGVLLTVVTRLREPLGLGDEVWAKFEEEKIHIFDRDTGKRLTH